MISKQNYFSVVLIFFIIFVMFMLVPVISDKLSESTVDVQSAEGNKVHVSNVMLDDALDETVNKPVQAISGDSTISTANNPRAAIVVSSQNDSMVSILKEWCIYNKYRYNIFIQLPQAATLSAYDTVLFGNIQITTNDVGTLQQYAKSGIPMIFTTLPAYETLDKNPTLADFFGINKCVSPSYKLDGVKIFGDFFLSKERIYRENDEYGELNDMEINIPYYTLRTGYEVYSVAVLKNQGEIKNEELPALLWRTYTESSQIYVINSNVFYGQKLLGVITAFMSQASDDYLYPIVNSQNIITLNYPFYSSENSQAIMEKYNRSTQGFSQDILWPNIDKILNNYGLPYNFFVAPQMDYTNYEALSNDDIMMYWKEIKKTSGVMGLSLQQVSSSQLWDVLSKDEDSFQKSLPAYSFKALYAGDFSNDELNSALSPGKEKFLKNITLALFNFDDNGELFGFMNNDVLSVMMTMNGFQHESMDDIQMLSLETSLGLCIQEADISHAFFPQREGDDWSKLSTQWAQGDTYFDDYKKFDDTTVYELENRVRNFLAMNYSYKKKENAINISIENFNGEAWFVLRVHNEKVKSTTNCVAKQLSDTAYLIKAEAANATIDLQESNFLNPPG